MKKIILIISIIVVLSVPFIVRPRNFFELYAPFSNDQFLLASATIPDPEKESILDLRWPKWFIRFFADRHDFNFKDNLENNQSTLQFILAGYFEHQEKASDPEDMNYILSMAERAINEGSDINNVADFGLSALHEAVLFNSLDVAKFLVSKGAKCDVLLARPGKKVDGMDAVEFAEFLYRKKGANRTDLIAFLKSSNCNKKPHADTPDIIPSN